MHANFFKEFLCESKDGKILGRTIKVGKLAQ